METSEFPGLDEERARAFAAAWLPAWSGNRPHDLIAFYTDDVYYSDPGVPEGIRGREALLEYFIRLLGYDPNRCWTHRSCTQTSGGARR